VGRTSAAGRRNGVRRARLLAELTQAQLAEAVGVTRQTIVAIEAGDYAPSVYLALAICHRLGVTVEELFDPSGTASTPENQMKEFS
jgi:putative transcriptional regulator